MANWDFVFPYDLRAAEWLAEQALPHPDVIPGNHLPSTAEVVVAWRLFDKDKSLLIENFNWEDPASVPTDAFRVRGDRFKALQVLAKVSERCGQLWLYPDTGEPAIVVDALTNAREAATTHAEAATMPDSWKYFYATMYGP